MKSKLLEPSLQTRAWILQLKFIMHARQVVCSWVHVIFCCFQYDKHASCWSDVSFLHRCKPECNNCNNIWPYCSAYAFKPPTGRQMQRQSMSIYVTHSRFHTVPCNMMLIVMLKKCFLVRRIILYKSVLRALHVLHPASFLGGIKLVHEYVRMLH